jgi:SAM-dependent methyltransferase
MKLSPDETRTPEQIELSYKVERELADRLRRAPRAERLRLYTQLYDEWHRRVPFDPELGRRTDPSRTHRAVKRLARMVRPFLAREGVFLEIGAGDGSLSKELAADVRLVYALEVSRTVIGRVEFPINVVRLVYDGFHLPLLDNSIAFAFSNQILEHLHPDDAWEHLERVCTVLQPGGRYMCITPNRLSGPHDISKYFDRVATGFHLKEYTVRELRELFLAAGFSRTCFYIDSRRAFVRFPIAWMVLKERVFEALPYPVSRFFTRKLPMRQMLGIVLVGVK